MATLKVLNGKGKYRDVGAREDVINYICNPVKTPSMLRGAVAIDGNIAECMNKVADRFGKVNGVQLRHFVLSFTPDELDDPEEVYQVARYIGQFIGQNYQSIFAVHEDTYNLHVHFMFNSISYRDGHRYSGTKKEYYDLVNFVRKLLWDNYRIKLMTVSSKSDEDIQ